MGTGGKGPWRHRTHDQPPNGPGLSDRRRRCQASGPAARVRRPPAKICKQLSVPEFAICGHARQLTGDKKHQFRIKIRQRQKAASRTAKQPQNGQTGAMRGPLLGANPLMPQRNARTTALTVVRAFHNRAVG